MRIHFDVHGASQEELEREAARILDGFTNSPLKFVTITAEPEQSAMNGTVITWRGEVEAQV